MFTVRIVGAVGCFSFSERQRCGWRDESPLRHARPCPVGIHTQSRCEIDSTKRQVRSQPQGRCQNGTKGNIPQPAVSERDILQQAVSERDIFQQAVSERDILQQAASERDILQQAVSERERRCEAIRFRSQV